MTKYQGLNIAVLGAGVIGLSTALSIKQELSHANVTIITEKVNDETLSAGAGGLFRPELNIGPSTTIISQWYKDSYEHFMKLLMCPEVTGIQQVSGYHLSSISRERIQNAVLQELLPDYRDLTEKEMKLFPAHFKCGIFYTTLVVDCRFYLPWMKNRFESQGGKFIYRKLKSLNELSDSRYDVIVNCTGFGSKDLLGDFKLVPIRGQTIKVKAPWIKHFYFADEAYIIPGVEYVTLGGIKEYGNWNMNVSPENRQFIWSKCTDVVPSLQKAEVMWEWVGLRPFRQPVCVEEDNSFGDKKIIHNYGHGGHGVSLSWGSALHATRLVVEAFSKMNAKL